MNIIKKLVKDFLNQEVKLISELAAEKKLLTILKLEEELYSSVEIQGLNVKVKGKTDRIDSITGTIRVIDYKTGKWEVSQKGIADNLQLGIYALAMSLLMPGKEIYAELHYLRSGKRKGHLYTPEDIENVKVKLISLINNIIEDTSFAPTSNVRACSYCDHAKSGSCGTGVFRNKKYARA